VANRFPLIVDSANLNIKEIPSGDTLDITGNDLFLSDNDKAIFGAGSDLQIYHDSSDSLIIDSGSGNLLVGSNSFYLRNAANNETMLRADENSYVKLYYDNAEKLATTSTGIDVTGLVEFDSLSGTGSVAITDILDEDNMASNSATVLVTQQSVKAYVDAQVDTVDTLAEILAIGNVTGGTDLVISIDDDLTTLTS